MSSETKIAEGDYRKLLPRFTPEAMQKNQALVDLRNRIAREKSATPAQLALAWLLAQHPWIIPIPGAAKLHRLQENIGASTVELTAADLAEIDCAAAAIQIEGDRYPPQLQAMIGEWRRLALRRPWSRYPMISSEATLTRCAPHRMPLQAPPRLVEAVPR